jgi:hypothetical protein
MSFEGTVKEKKETLNKKENETENIEGKESR